VSLLLLGLLLCAQMTAQMTGQGAPQLEHGITRNPRS
jgi:hypothetical protein